MNTSDILTSFQISVLSWLKKQENVYFWQLKCVFLANNVSASIIAIFISNWIIVITPFGIHPIGFYFRRLCKYCKSIYLDCLLCCSKPICHAHKYCEIMLVEFWLFACIQLFLFSFSMKDCLRLFGSLSNCYFKLWTETFSLAMWCDFAVGWIRLQLLIGSSNAHAPGILTLLCTSNWYCPLRSRANHIFTHIPCALIRLLLNFWVRSTSQSLSFTT